MTDSHHQMLAAIDLGSNSFHITLAEQLEDGLRWQEALSEKVQLAAGLDDSLWLDAAARERGLACLARFAERISAVERSNLRVVATSTLRTARNASDFLRHAEALLGCRIEVISGREEARLINLGVAHALADNQPRRLVVDIGGGSTELVIGEGFGALKTESLFMGCVGFTRRFFADDRLSESNYRAASLAARQQLQTIEADYRACGWQVALGSSGTIKAVALACAGKEATTISADCIADLRRHVLSGGHLGQLNLRGVAPDRCRIFPAGLAILQAVMEQLGIEQLDYVEGALREGVIYDMVGAARHGNPADASLATLMRRCHVDTAQAERVAASAAHFYAQQHFTHLAPVYRQRLLQAAQVHEVGLAISHDQYDKHGAYLLQHADLAGFARHEQKQLAHLVQAQRRKLPPQLLQTRDGNWIDMAVLLRLAVCLHHARRAADYSHLHLQRTARNHWSLLLPHDWQQSRPLLCADLQQEQTWLQKAGIQLQLHYTADTPASTPQTV